MGWTGKESSDGRNVKVFTLFQRPEWVNQKNPDFYVKSLIFK